MRYTRDGAQLKVRLDSGPEGGRNVAHG